MWCNTLNPRVVRHRRMRSTAAAAARALLALVRLEMHSKSSLLQRTLGYKCRFSGSALCLVTVDLPKLALSSFHAVRTGTAARSAALELWSCWAAASGIAAEGACSGCTTSGRPRCCPPPHRSLTTAIRRSAAFGTTSFLSATSLLSTTSFVSTTSFLSTPSCWRIVGGLRRSTSFSRRTSCGRTIGVRQGSMAHGEW